VPLGGKKTRGGHWSKKGIRGKPQIARPLGGVCGRGFPSKLLGRGKQKGATKQNFATGERGEGGGQVKLRQYSFWGKKSTVHAETGTGNVFGWKRGGLRKGDLPMEVGGQGRVEL